ncbi:hypothetical protein BDV96DRAFT_575819 [Lophiotrema nucula]|uniref:Uncharacterized protein n=1 Tax=Lophiotrema nucula TaxID=690887 RepID=A0A6A5Z5X5_9PLEO|nr:hypothetical protein BDV96DRAFT_575819 [Lophiotrema nucula]
MSRPSEKTPLLPIAVPTKLSTSLNGADDKSHTSEVILLFVSLLVGAFQLFTFIYFDNPSARPGAIERTLGPFLFPLASALPYSIVIFLPISAVVFLAVPYIVQPESVGFSRTVIVCCYLLVSTHAAVFMSSRGSGRLDAIGLGRRAR